MVAVAPSGIKQRGRILLWRGGSIWIGWAGAAADFHAHHAIQISLVLSTGSMQLCTPAQDWQSYTAAIISANQPHAFMASGEQTAVIFVEPESTAGLAIKARFGAGIEPLPQVGLQPLLGALKTVYDQQGTDQALMDCAIAVTNHLATTVSSTPHSLDLRIVKAVELIQQQLGQSINLSDIAAAVALSPERFRHLFMAQTGVRFRPYVLWSRLGCALTAYTSGRSLTEAAYAAGFADSAHLSRSFRRMFGLVPTNIQLD